MTYTVVNNGATVTVTVVPNTIGPKGDKGDTPSYDGLTFVDSISVLPEPVNNVITLPTGAYMFLGTIDLNGSRLVLTGDTAILGGSSETSFLTSTGLASDQWLITTNSSLPMQNITIRDVTKGVQITGDSTNTAIDWDAVNFLNVPQSVSATNVTNFIVLNSAYLNSGGLLFSGNQGTVGFTGTLFSIPTGVTGISFAADAIITRRIRFDVCPFNVQTGATGINLPAGTTLPNSNYIIHRCNFSGAGTALSGVQPSDNKSFFTGNVGIENSGIFGFLQMQENATATTITTLGVAVKAAGITTNNEFTRGFTHSNNRLTFAGVIEQLALISVTLTLSAGNNERIGVYIAKNGVELPNSEVYTTTGTGGRSENVALQVPTLLSNGDYFEVWVENESSTTNITVQYLNMAIKT
jgi:hypothetical protein